MTSAHPRAGISALLCPLLIGLLSLATLQMAAAETPAGVPQPVRFAPPRDASIPDDAAGRQILLGRRLVVETKQMLPDNVGNALNCSDCHLGAGKVPFAAPFVGVAVNYPRNNPRAGRVLTLPERINGCFLRSMNGTALLADSPEMQALVAYFNWLSTGLPAKAKVQGAGIGKIDNRLIPDPVRGKDIYASKCAECHGDNGQGSTDRRGDRVFPPLWGDQSFNIGAGMARTYTAAAYIKQNMPIGYGLNPPLGQGGALSDQDAVDVAAYFTHQPRPDFPAKVTDWPNGGKPKDGRY